MTCLFVQKLFIQYYTYGIGSRLLLMHVRGKNVVKYIQIKAADGDAPTSVRQHLV